jgi:hypothetical protein
MEAVVGAALRWTAALAAVGILGFAAGRYLGRTSAAPTFSFPAVTSTGDAPATTGAVSMASRAPTTIHDILKLQGDFTQSAALYVLAANSDEEGIERLLDEAVTVGRASERRAAATILYERYSELDPAAAVEHMTKHAEQFDINSLYAIFYGWARQDLDAAVARAAKLDDRNRSVAGTAIVRSRDDLPPADREALGSKLKLQVAVRDPSIDLRSPQAAEQAWRSALAVRDRNRRQQGLYQLAHEWAQKDPEATLRAIESLTDRNEQTQLLGLAVEAWSQNSPRDAFEWVAARPPSAIRTQLLAGTIGTWITKDPPAAIAMLDRLSPTERNQAMPQVISTWAGMDPQAAAAWAVKQEGEPIYVTVLLTVANQYADHDPDEATRWASTIAGERGQEVLSQVIQQIAHGNPGRAAGLVGQLDEGGRRDMAIASVAQAWAQQDPRAALAWVATQPRSETTPDVYRSIFSEWSVYEADSAASQVNFLLDTDLRNAAIVGILENASPDPRLLDSLYMRVEGTDMRRRAAQILYLRLRDTDPQASERFRAAAGIDEEPTLDLGSIVVN